MREKDYSKQGSPPEALNMLWLGTAGTGKTETLKALLRHWEGTGFGEVRIAAYTGVAASNVGLGATTVHQLFRLADVNAASGELNPLQGPALEEVVAANRMHDDRKLQGQEGEQVVPQDL